MFDRIFDFIASVIYWFQFWIIIDQYERGVVLTLGKYRGREVGPGLHWVWPFGIDMAITDNVVRAPLPLPSQNLTSLDGVDVLLAPIVTWSIADIVKVLLENEGAEEVLMEITQNEIAQAVQTQNWEDITQYEFVRKLRKKIRRRAATLGVRVIDFGLSDLTRRSRAIRLLHD